MTGEAPLEGRAVGGDGAAPRAFGRRGEALAAAWYEAAGYVVLERNWRSPFGGELDLVCCRGGLLVVCEVKARRSDRHGSPLEAVDERKRRQLRRLAAQYLAASPRARRGSQVRFDVAVVAGSAGVEVVEDAFA